MIKTILCAALLTIVSKAAEKPNVVIVITDDQGYGDLASNGHPYAITPHIDKLSKESVSLTDFHVFPTCSPTRAALMTGHWANRTGVWHTINGRSLIRKGEVTIASMFKDAGYETGIFGKWHLGDAYPFRPQDKGFTETFHHGAGGVGQTPDVWNNDYFTGSYYNNGKITKADGFCTDVFFDKANEWITKCTKEDKPFFAYIASNAPHSPLLAPQKYLDMYKDQPGAAAAFYGMITNIDDNVGKTRELLKSLEIEDNTIFIYMTDNGSAHGSKIYNAGMKGKKNSPYDGGHRVPFMLYYPKMEMTKERKVETLTHIVDIAPTLLELTGTPKTEGVTFDGVSILELLKGNAEGWPERYVITDSQRVIDPIKWRSSSVMIQDWRLVNGKELYYIPEDPGQENDLAAEKPEMVTKLRAHYEEWWAELEPGYAETSEFIIGNEKSKIVTLTAHDWIGPALPPWNQTGIRQIKKRITPKFVAHWAIDVETPATYQVAMYRWAPEANAKLTASLPAEPDRPGIDKPYSAFPGEALKIKSLVVNLNDKEVVRKDIDPDAIYEPVDLELPAGKGKFQAYFILEDGKHVGVTYAVFTKK